MTSNTTKYWPAGLLFFCLPFACSDGSSNDEDGQGGAPAAGGAGFWVASGGTGAAASGGTGSGQKGASGGSATEGGLEICEVSGRATVGRLDETPVLDDFDDGDSWFDENGLAGWWYAYTDETAGTQTPTGDLIKPVAGGLDESGYALRVHGEGFTHWGSGFGAYLAFPQDGKPCLFDASEYSGISFWARGFVTADETAPAAEAGTFRVQLIEKDVTPVEEGGTCDVEGACWDSHRVRLVPSECWHKYSIPFDEFTPDGWGLSGGDLDADQLYLLGFEVSNGQTYDLWIDQIEFFVGAPADEESRCATDGLGGSAGASGAAGM